MAALSRFGLTILIAGNDSCCGDEDADHATPPAPLTNGSGRCSSVVGRLKE